MEPIVNRRVLILSAVLACAARVKTQQDNSAEPPPIAGVSLPGAPTMTLAAIGPGQPAGRTDGRTPIAEGAIAPNDGPRADEVLHPFGGQLEQRKFGGAYRLWA